MITFQYYHPDIYQVKPIGFVSLEEFYRAIQFPKHELREVFLRIKQAEADGDMATKSDLKCKLHSFTPAVHIGEARSYENITRWTGLMPVDFDHLKPEYANEFKNYLFSTYEFIAACWLSASGHGVRALVKIPICASVEEYKLYFLGLKEVLGVYFNFDEAPKNCVLPLFLSYDPNLLIRDEPEEWTGKFVEMPVRTQIQYRYDSTNRVERIKAHIQKAIDRIHDNGHPQLRAAAYAMGGFVANNYIDRDDAIQFMYDAIEGNPYLSCVGSTEPRKIRAKIKTYKRTALTMIDKGTDEPLSL